jgi:hypothetical protein
MERFIKHFRRQPARDLDLHFPRRMEVARPRAHPTKAFPYANFETLLFTGPSDKTGRK